MKPYREVRGGRGHKQIDDGSELVHLQHNEHFHSREPRSIARLRTPVSERSRELGRDVSAIRSSGNT